MLIAGTLWLIFSLLLVITNQLLLINLFVNEAQPLILLIAAGSFILGSIFYYRYFTQKK